MKKILNIGVQTHYNEGLVRKIRISNLIAIISIIILLLFLPMSIYLGFKSAIVIIVFFISAAIANFILHSYAFHFSAFVTFTLSGYIYFFFATILFGLNSNIHFFYLILCMISAVIFDKKWVLMIFINLALFSFFFLLWYMHKRPGIIIITDELQKIQDVVALVITFFLFVITSIFFIFFKTENSRYQFAIEQQKEHIEEVHKEITDSINYAERIQRSFLATKELLDENLGEYFVFFQPKDVVSGDFYFASSLKNGNFAVVNADSTGHGVPGAIMSILNISSLEKAVEKGITEPNEIFNETRKHIIERLKKDGSPEGGKDGMDASIVSFDFNANKIYFAAANNPIWLVRNNEVIQFQHDKMPVGKHDKDQVPFTPGEYDIQKGDIIYTFTDGFQDQFGGEKGKKFMVKKLREYLVSISHLSMQEQHDKIKEEFENWKGNYEQVDDVCIIGVRV